MAGMLPGVESARRRRFHQARSLDLPNSRIDLTLGSRWNPSLYETNRGHYHQSQRPRYQQQVQTHITVRSESQSEQKDDSKLHEAALEARERLDERLRASALVKKRHDSFWHRHSSSYGEHHMICSQNGARHLSNTDWHYFGGSVTEPRRLTDLASQNFNLCSPGLSKTCIDLIPREVFTPVQKTKGQHWIKIKLRASEQEDCSVCLESFQADQVLIRLPCTHRFHSDCLMPWLDSHSHCPYCRMKISTKTF